MPVASVRAWLVPGGVVYALLALIIGLGLVPIGRSVSVAIATGTLALARLAVLAPAPLFWLFFLAATLAVAVMAASLVNAETRLGRWAWGIGLVAGWVACGLAAHYFVVILQLPTDFPEKFWPFF